MGIKLYNKPIEIELSGAELLVNNLRHSRSQRTVKEISSTLMEKAEDELDKVVYYMFRDVYKKENIRFDITLIPAISMNKECAKTHGHYHPKGEDGFAYPELYQVLKGKCIFILQKKNKNDSVDVIIVKANEGEVIIFPPGYGHVSINSGPSELILSNLVYDRFEARYEEYKKNRGAAYYYLKDGQLVQNSNYMIGKSEQITANELNKKYNYECKDLLTEFYENQKKFEFLVKPSLFFKK